MAVAAAAAVAAVAAVVVEVAAVAAVVVELAAGAGATSPPPLHRRPPRAAPVVAQAMRVRVARVRVSQVEEVQVEVAVAVRVEVRVEVHPRRFAHHPCEDDARVPPSRWLPTQPPRRSAGEQGPPHGGDEGDSKYIPAHQLGKITIKTYAGYVDSAESRAASHHRRVTTGTPLLPPQRPPY